LVITLILFLYDIHNNIIPNFITPNLFFIPPEEYIGPNWILKYSRMCNWKYLTQRPYHVWYPNPIEDLVGGLVTTIFWENLWFENLDFRWTPHWLYEGSFENCIVPEYIPYFETYSEILTLVNRRLIDDYLDNLIYEHLYANGPGEYPYVDVEIPDIIITREEAEGVITISFDAIYEI